jgi:hypothetical protein
MVWMIFILATHPPMVTRQVGPLKPETCVALTKYIHAVRDVSGHSPAWCSRVYIPPQLLKSK